MTRLTLRERMRFYFEFDCNKHDLCDAYVDKQLNAMSNVELIDALSLALEGVLEGDNNDE